MRQAGYKVTIQTYNYRASEIVGVPQFTTSARTYLTNHDWFVARLSGAGTLTAPVQPASGAGTGCSPQDLTGFVRGNIALLQRGSCAWDQQVEHAAQAGAAGIIVYNRQDNANGIAMPAHLHHPATVPVVSTSFAVGSDLSQLHASGQTPTAHLDVRTQQVSSVDYNLI
nr:hypothetical protein [Terriglobales bacterium]